MKTKSIIAIAGIILAGVVLVTHSPVETGQPTTAPIRKSVRPPRHDISKPAPDAADAMKPAPSAEAGELDEEANLAGWEQRFQSLLSENANREDAVAVLLSEIDSTFGKWAESQLAPLAELPPNERYDSLEIIDASIREGAAAIIELLELPGSRHVAVAAGALEAVAAEVQYAEVAPDHASRLAMLRLDRERQQRLGGLMSITDEAERAKAMGELDQWYEAGLAQVFPADVVDDAMN
jgi:hypothetical protein